jgi:hypothetical protein
VTPSATGAPVPGAVAPGIPDGRLLGGNDHSHGEQAFHKQRSEPQRAGASQRVEQQPAQASETEGPRKVKLTVARIDPWSAMKLSFLLSVAFAIATVVASIAVWQVLNAMGVFDQLNATLRELAGNTSKFNIHDYIGLGRVTAIATLVSLVNVVVTMALSTLGAVLYNIAGSLVGGLSVTLSDD